MALKLAPAGAVIEVMQHLVADPNSRVRLIAAGSLLAAEPGNTLAGAVLVEALEDPVLRVREAALVLLDSLGEGGMALLEGLKDKRCHSTQAIHDHFPGPAVAAGQAVFSSGVYAYSGGEPESPRPLMESGSLVDCAPAFEIVERKLIAIQQLAS